MCVERGVGGGWILGFGRFGVGWVLSGWVSRVGRSRSLGFFGGFCDSVGGGRLVVGVVIGEGGGSFAGGGCIWWWGGRCCVVGGWQGGFLTSCMGSRGVLRCCGEGMYEVCYECV